MHVELPTGLSQASWVLIEALLLYAAATVTFDAIHFTLHRWMRSRHPRLRGVGSLHAAHHAFLDSRLRVNRRWASRNLMLHVVPEYLTQLSVTVLGVLAFSPAAVVLVVAYETTLFVVVAALRGHDAYHRRKGMLARWRGGLVVTPAYHAHHHRFPDAFFGSVFPVIDWVFGTACSLKGRKVVLTGASGVFGAAMRRRLEACGATVSALKYGREWTYADYTGADALLATADILILAHGAKGEDAMRANCDSFVELSRRFVALAGDRFVCPEIWAVGSEIECHPAFGVPALQEYARSKRAFARHARFLFDLERVVYRHIVPSAFTSPMGRGLMSGDRCAQLALALIRRGFRYVPVTYTGIALLNWFRFRFGPSGPLWVEGIAARESTPRAA